MKYQTTVKKGIPTSISREADLAKSGFIFLDPTKV